jgi:hypothetical protein
MCDMTGRGLLCFRLCSYCDTSWACSPCLFFFPEFFFLALLHILAPEHQRSINASWDFLFIG